MRKALAFSAIIVILLIGLIIAEEKYEISEEELEDGYTQDLVIGDSIEFPIGGEKHKVEMLSISDNVVELDIAEYGEQKLSLNGDYSHEIKVEVNYDDIYDVIVELQEINNEEPKNATINVQKIEGEVPENEELPYACEKYYECEDGTKVDYCTKSGDICTCELNPQSQCSDEDETGEDNEDEDESGKSTEAREIKDERNRIKFEERTGEQCPEDCTCTGVVTKCELEDGSREMTVYTQSGNIIVQVKGVNVTTQVTLYHHNKSLYGVFEGNQTKKIILPDEASEKAKQRVRAKIDLEELELTEEGYYEITIGKRARLFYIIPVREKVQARLMAENGEIVRIRNPWWGWLARDTNEDDES